ncbi:hypothetical protein N7532_011670 [Penicillium argentinense]|uniref:Uncharacterized protein n=1 Tax=Penicillium argentinense TaxID=1131581 RepID=A0A9W9EIX9_9EURO|nr:uncharacterized protein N7532_011670 [Penicillium argentinense]KAJ5082627.1 hypothetical protein N7532_011670 [Penicillium argentinense]
MGLSLANLTKSHLHKIIGGGVLIIFILVIARLAVKGTPASRTNTWGIAVCVKSGVFLAYQLLTAHFERLKRWASTKANMILNIIDTVFWFALFIITILGTMGALSEASRALGGIIATLTVPLLRHFKKYGSVREDSLPKSAC